MYVGNAMVVALNLPLTDLRVRLRKVPYGALFPPILRLTPSRW
jgi:TctA family transporter